MRAASASNASIAEAFRPSTSTMSRDGAPRANEIASGIAPETTRSARPARSAPRRRGRELHIDLHAILAEILAHGHGAHSRQRGEGALELPDRARAHERPGGDREARTLRGTALEHL